MTGGAPNGGAGNSLERLEQAIAVTDRFEAAWRRRPRVEDFLEGDAGDDLLRRLIAVELSLRAEAGDWPSPGEYHGRFPGKASAVDAAFGEQTRDTAPYRDGPAPANHNAATLAALGPVDPNASTLPQPETGAEPDRLEVLPPNGRFRVKGEYRRGGLGKVSRAYDRELRREVAFKEILDDFAGKSWNRNQFLLEGLVTGGLEHPGIVPVYGLGSHEDGRLFYAMRFVHGDSLQAEAKTLHNGAPAGPGDDPPTLPRLLRHFVSACHAVDYAHGKGVLHRDLKPEHVLLGPHGETLVVDWGLAMPFRREGPGGPHAEGALRLPAEVESAVNLKGGAIGTIRYMSPEQARGEVSRLDPRSDVYSLGATLYYVLTGRDAFDRAPDAVQLERVKAGRFPVPRDVNRNVPPALAAVCLKAMRPDPADRYQTARELARDVERWLDDEPTKAYPEPWNVRAWRWARKHRTLTVSGLTLLAAACLALGAGYAVVREKNRELGLAYTRIDQRNRELASANGRVLVEKRAAEGARDEARVNFDTSRKVVHDMLFRVARADLPRIAGADLMRLKVAGEASQYLKTLMDQRPTDPAVRYQAAQSYRELGKVLQILGRKDAINAFVQSINILNPLTREFPDRTYYADYLSEVSVEGGEFHRAAGAFQKAENFFKKADAVSAGLLKTDPDAPRFRKTRARALYSNAAYRADKGEFDESLRLSAGAIDLLKPLADGPDAEWLVRMELAMTHGDRGAALARGGRPEEARESLDEAGRRAETLLTDTPDHRDLRYIAAAALAEKASVLPAAEAGPVFDDAVARLEGLAEESPKIPHYRRRLAEAVVARARFHREGGRPDRAQADAQRARDLLRTLLDESKGHPIDSGLLGRATGELGRLALARGDRDGARALFGSAIDLQKIALKTNPTGPTDRSALREHEEAIKGLGAAGPAPVP